MQFNRRVQRSLDTPVTWDIVSKVSESSLHPTPQPRIRPLQRWGATGGGWRTWPRPDVHCHGDAKRAVWRCSENRWSLSGSYAVRNGVTDRRLVVNMVRTPTFKDTAAVLAAALMVCAARFLCRGRNLQVVPTVRCATVLVQWGTGFRFPHSECGRCRGALQREACKPPPLPELQDLCR